MQHNSYTPLNPCAQSFTPLSQHSRDESTSTLTSTLHDPTHTRHTRARCRPTHKASPSASIRRTPRTAPIALTHRPAIPPSPNPSTQMLWENAVSSLQESTLEQFSITFDMHTVSHSSSSTTPPDLKVAYINIRSLNPTKHLFITAFIQHYCIDVLFLTDTRISNLEASKYTLKTSLGWGYTILHTPPIQDSPGGQAIIIAPSWSGAYQSFWTDETDMGLLTEVTLRSGAQNVKLYGTYWPCANEAQHSYESTLTRKLPTSPNYTDWRSYLEYHLLQRLTHGEGHDCAWSLGGDFNCTLTKTLQFPEPTTLAEWAHLIGLNTPPSSREWSNSPTFIGAQGQSRIDHVFSGGRACQCLTATLYSGECYSDYSDHRPISISLQLQHGRGPAGLRCSRPLPLYKAILLPKTPADELKFKSQL